MSNQPFSHTVERLRNGLIVSCQAKEGSALAGPAFMAALAREAERGGAAGLRVNGPADIAAVKQATRLPVIGIFKQAFEGYAPYITATFDLARRVVEAGADLVAFDATGRPLPDGLTVPEMIERIHVELDVPVMADVSTLAEGIAAARAGADLVSTTLAGYTPHSRPAIPHTPDFALVQELAGAMETCALRVPIVVEGRVTTPEHVTRAFVLGAFAVCVGDAITNPAAITRRFVAALPAEAAR